MKQQKAVWAPVWPTEGGQPPWVTFSFWDLIPEAVLFLWLRPVSPPQPGSPIVLPPQQ